MGVSIDCIYTNHIIEDTHRIDKYLITHTRHDQSLTMVQLKQYLSWPYCPMEYTIKDICRKLQVSDKTVRRFISKLELDSPELYKQLVHKTGGRHSLYKLTEKFYALIKKEKSKGTRHGLDNVLPKPRKSENKALQSEASEVVETLKATLETLKEQLKEKDQQLERKDQLLAQQVMTTQKLQEKLFMIEDKKMNIFQRIFRRH